MGVLTGLFDFLFEHVDYITAGASGVVSLYVMNDILKPIIFHPFHWGGIPWTPPGMISTFFFDIILIIIVNLIVHVILSVLSVLKQCPEKLRPEDWDSFFKTSSLTILIFAVLLLISKFFPQVKTLYYLFTSKSSVATGLFIGTVMMAVHFMNAQLVRDSVCERVKR